MKKVTKEEIKKKVVKCHEYLKVPLTDAELLELGQESAKGLSDINSFELQLQEVSKRLKYEIAQKEVVVAKCSELIRNKYDYRDVDCEWDFDYKKRMKNLTRLDTGEVIRNAKLTADELQEELAFDKEQTVALAAVEE